MAYVYINGYPGVGKFTVAKELMHARPLALATVLLQLTSNQEAHTIVEAPR